MSTPQFSSGEWHLQKLPPDDWDAEPGYRITAQTTLFLTVTPCADGYVPGENEANAKLIVCSPRMYAMLERMLKRFMECDIDEELDECRSLLLEAREGPPDESRDSPVDASGQGS